MASTEISPLPAEAQLPYGSEEELAGPPRTATAPVQRAERLSSIDILRGFALLGILMLNINSFAGPGLYHDIPVGLPKPAFVGPHTHLNLVILSLVWVFFEGKMRALFSMLFGAGVVLLTSRAEKRGAGIRTADIYVRRNMWLCVLGLIHGTFLWYGDILYAYGLSALLILFPFRVLKPKTLFIMGILIAVVVGTVQLTYGTGLFDDLRLGRKVAAITADQKAGKPLTAEQKKALEDWNALSKKKSESKANTDERMARAHAGYISTLLKTGLEYGSRGINSFYSFEISDAVGAMLIGMALFKSGFLTAELPYATYLWTAILGFAISAPLYIAAVWKAYLSGFSFLSVEEWFYVPYALTRTAGAIAIAAVLLILIKSGAFRLLLRPFAAVGQTALSNYLLTTVLCQTLFLWGPWKLYGKLEYYQYLYVVFAVWAINLIVSPLWLRAFEFGPVEWLWRSLTYWKPQPMRLRA